MKKFFITATVFLVLLASCEKDPHEHNDEELITTLKVDFTNTQSGAVSTLLFQDLDGDGGDAPVITADNLAANASYTVALSVLNESESPADNITAEIQEEAVDHQFFFEKSSGLNLNFSYNDADENGKPIGLSNTATTGVASNGTLTVTLRHQPDKGASGVSAGDITNAGGASDIEVTFNVVVQ
ncbi:MAG: hypothetical protein R2777_02790 [Chitinophagales bacterium]|nr:type 1 periplasmic binding fold superfamily protein [Bacteroidota bacterium]MCB9226811.1 type 1 periplasmic binding fold superfamily protein [Chitinophagales bacterium]